MAVWTNRSIQKRTITQVFAHGGVVVRSHPDGLFAGLAGCRNPLRGPRDFIESKARSFRDGIGANDYAVAATSTRVKAR